MPASAGAYIRYPLRDLLRILALESRRHNCLVVGEDLGTVPRGFRPVMRRAGILSCRVLPFERRRDGSFKPPAAYPALAAASAGTHDLAPIKAWWLGADIRLREAAGQYPDEAARDHDEASRSRDRRALLTALQEQRLLSAAMATTLLPSDGPPVFDPALTTAVHRFLHLTPSRTRALPGRGSARLCRDGQPAGDGRRTPELAPALRGPVPISWGLLARHVTDRCPEPLPPRATYRLQLTRDFTFAQAGALAPYLARLGISHTYLSPILAARRGSTHGYDVVDHSCLAPDLGSLDDFRAMVAAFRGHGIGLIVDIVPNHMGIGPENPRWMDVLRWGSGGRECRVFRYRLGPAAALSGRQGHAAGAGSPARHDPGRRRNRDQP